MPKQNKPNGQFQLDFKPETIKAFMHDLSIRKVPGVGRVHERLLDSIGIKVIFLSTPIFTIADSRRADLWRYLCSKSCFVVDGQGVRVDVPPASIPGHCV